MPSVSPSHVAIVGGGVCGLGVGWKLAQAGVRATLFERGEPARSSTWASAGMLAPNLELRPEEEPITILGRESMRRWEKFARDLEADAGMSIDYRAEGMLFVALDRDAREQLEFLLRHQREIGLEVEWLSGYEARQREPHLSRNVVAAIHAPGDHQVDSRLLSEALMRAFTLRGGEIRANTPVERIVLENGAVRGVQVGGDFVPADAVVLAAGAWSGLVEGLPEPVKPPVRPIRGQLLVLRQPTPPVLDHCVWATSGNRFVYYAPKSDGKLLLGATVEEAGYDDRPTAGAALDLLRAGWETLPAIYEMPLVEFAVGLRPASRDNAPILGKTPVPGLFMATGHYRNGILFAPITSAEVADVVLTGETGAAIQAFGLKRFAG